MSAVSLTLYALFAACAALVLVPGTPWRWSLAAFMALSHLTLPSLAGGGGDLVLDNLAKAVILPTVLLGRTRLGALRLLVERPMFGVWIGFFVFSGVAVLWSPFPEDGVKAVGYLYGYTATIMIFWFSLRRKREEVVSAFRAAAWFGLAAACVQTFLLGGRYSGASADRFSSFVAPQSFGVFLALSFGVLTVFHLRGRRRPASHDLLLVVLVPAVILNGSRFSLAAVAAITCWSVGVWLVRNTNLRRLSMAAVSTTVVLAVLMGGLYLAPRSWWSNLDRPGELPRAAALLGVVSGSYDLEDIGTMRFRLEMYEAILDYSASRSRREHWFGSGTSSVGEVVATGYYKYRQMDFVTVDANRVAHNEFLRVYYDLGVVGLALMIVLCCGLIVAALRLALRERAVRSWILVALIMVVLVALASQNLFAASVHPSGMVVSLIVALVLVRWDQAPRSPAPARFSDRGLVDGAVGGC